MGTPVLADSACGPHRLVGEGGAAKTGKRGGGWACGTFKINLL